MKIDRKEVIASLGGEAAVKEHGSRGAGGCARGFLAARLEPCSGRQVKAYPTVAELESRVDKRGYRRGVGRLFLHEHSNKNPEADESKLTRRRGSADAGQADLVDFFKNRFVRRRICCRARARANARGLGGDHPRLPAARRRRRR